MNTEKKNKTLPPAVAAIAQLKLIGNITPRRWYEEIVFESGKPDFAAICILAELMYQYRPYQVYDQKTGDPRGWAKKFQGDRWQCSANYFQKFGLTKKQTLDATMRLANRDPALVIREIKDSVVIDKVRYNNVMYLEPVVSEVAKISFEDIDLTDEIHTLSPPGDRVIPPGDILSLLGDALKRGSITPSLVRDTLSLSGDTNTTTIQIPTNTTTTTPDSGSSSGKSGDLNEKTPGAVPRQETSTEGLYLDFGKIRAQERPALLKILEDLDDKAQAQDIVDELLDNIEAGTLRKTKPALLRALVQRANAGEFTPTSERGTARAQRKAVEEAQKQQPVKAAQEKKELTEDDKKARQEKIDAAKRALGQHKEKKAA
jgi:hypothetical protein